MIICRDPPFQFATLWRRVLVPDVEGRAQRHGLSQLGTLAESMAKGCVNADASTLA